MEPKFKTRAEYEKWKSEKLRKAAESSERKQDKKAADPEVLPDSESKESIAGLFRDSVKIPEPNGSTMTSSKLTKCEDCGKEVSKRAEQCPHCGAPIQIQTAQDPQQPPPKATKETIIPVSPDLTTCKSCGILVSRKASQCPNCGASPRSIIEKIARILFPKIRCPNCNYEGNPRYKGTGCGPWILLLGLFLVSFLFWPLFVVVFVMFIWLFLKPSQRICPKCKFPNPIPLP